MKRLATSTLSVLALVLLCGPALAQDFCPTVRKHVRAVSVSIEGHAKFQTSGKPTQVGSGTLFEKDGETFCITCAHVTAELDHSMIRVVQYCPDNPERFVSVFARLVSQDKGRDVTVLHVGSGVFPKAAKISRRKPKLDDAVLHVGSMAGLHHSLARGYVVGLHRGSPEHIQADITAFFGSSGGGVFNECGEYVGMVTSIIRGARITFFLPVDQMNLSACGLGCCCDDCECGDCPADCDCGCKMPPATP